MLQALGGLISLIVLFFKTISEKDIEKKAKKKELLSEAKQAIKDGDTSAITSVFDRIRRV